MASFNKVILMGNVTRDIELRYTPSKLAVTDIGLAVNDRRKNAQGEWVEEATFVDITLWGRTAEIASQYLSKGAPVLVEGRLKLDTWEKDGKKNSKLKVIGEDIRLLGNKGQGGGGEGRSSGGGGGYQQRGSSGGGGQQRNAPPPREENEYSQSGPDDYNQGGGGGDGGGGNEEIPF